MEIVPGLACRCLCGSGDTSTTSDFYAEPPFTSPWFREQFIFDHGYLSTVLEAGQAWAKSDRPPEIVSEYWEQLWAHRKDSVGAKGANARAWKMAAMKLVSIADEASAGVGFAPPPGEGSSVQRMVFDGHRQLLRKEQPDLPYLPYSLCSMVPADVACVQPKNTTPKLGCMHRSMTHHLALLPSVGEVATSWRFGHPAASLGTEFNLLLVPFPYKIEGRDFTAASEFADSETRFFDLKPGWLQRGGAEVPPAEVAQFVRDLIAETKKDGSTVHGVVFPEASLPQPCAGEVATILAEQESTLELLIAGTLHTTSDGTRNCASTYRMHGGRVLQPFHQSKHHRLLTIQAVRS